MLLVAAVVIAVRRGAGVVAVGHAVRVGTLAVAVAVTVVVAGAAAAAEAPQQVVAVGPAWLKPAQPTIQTTHGRHCRHCGRGNQTTTAVSAAITSRG